MSKLYFIGSKMNVVAARSKKTATIEIKDYIGEYYTYDANWNIVVKGITAESFKNELEKLIADGYTRVNIEINSGGGSIYDGDDIISTIKNNVKNIEIHTYVTGIAASMGASIFVSVKKENTHMYNHSKVMIHNAATSLYTNNANATYLRELADMLETYDESLSSLYAERMNMTKEDFMAQYMNGKDHYFTAEKAVSLGIAGDIIDQEADDVAKNNNMKEVFNYYEGIAASMKNESPSFLEKIKSLIQPIVQSEVSNYSNTNINNQIQTEVEMTQEEIKALVDSAVAEKVKPIQESLEATNKLVEDKDKKIEQLEADLEAARTANNVVIQPIANQVQPDAVVINNDNEENGIINFMKKRNY